MYILASKVWFADGSIWAELEDGRTIAAPIVWFPRLANATDDQLADFEIFPGGIHWPQIDEDVSIESLLMGRPEVRPAEASLQVHHW